MSIEQLYRYGRINEFSEQLFSSPFIWLATAASLNDPFECTPSFVFTHDQDQIMAQLIREIKRCNPALTHQSAVAEATAIYLQGRHRNPDIWESLKADLINEFRYKVGIYCLSERRDSILMWSHYAANHTGYCIEFEATDFTPVFGTALQVQYSDDYPEIDFYNTPAEEKPKLSLLRKFTDWSYEKEWRILNYEAGPCSLQYPTELMKSVTFGLRMDEQHKANIRYWLSRRGMPVKIYQTIQGRDRFEVNFVEMN